MSSNKFGYKKHQSIVVNLDNADTTAAKDMLEKEPSFAYCISCGSCAATCSAGQFTDFNLRKIQLMLKRGETDTVKEMINRCMLCGKCSMVCPKGVATRNIVLQISKILNQPNYRVPADKLVKSEE